VRRRGARKRVQAGRCVVGHGASARPRRCPEGGKMRNKRNSTLPLEPAAQNGPASPKEGTPRPEAANACKCWLPRRWRERHNCQVGGVGAQRRPSSAKPAQSARFRGGRFAERRVRCSDGSSFTPPTMIIAAYRI
jgi:hypothetical protein